MIHEPGEGGGFVGPNGAGKTTIGMLVGLIEPTSGRCFVKGMEVTKNPSQSIRLSGTCRMGSGFTRT